MTSEEWYNMTPEQYAALSEEEMLKHLIRFTEERYIYSNKKLEEIHKNKEEFPPADEMVIWYKQFLKEEGAKNGTELKKLRIAIEYCRSGLNPPWAYLEHQKNKKVKVPCPCCNGLGTVL